MKHCSYPCAIIASLLCFLVSVAQPASASPTPAATPTPAPSYVRFCSQYQNLTPGQTDKAVKKNSDLENRVPDDVVISAVRSRVPTSATVAVAIRQYNSMIGDRDGPKKVVVHIQGGADSRYQVATFSRDDRFLSLSSIDTPTVERWYQFARTMATYMLLNDLLASDAVVPRLGCSRVANVQIYAMAGVLPEIQAAFMNGPAQEQSLIKSALEAYHSFSESGEAKRSNFTRQALQHLGGTPDIALIYLDRAPDGSDAYGVVRLSNGDFRTYALLRSHGVNFEMSSPALCAVGDMRCVPYYVWP